MVKRKAGENANSTDTKTIAEKVITESGDILNDDDFLMENVKGDSAMAHDWSDDDENVQQEPAPIANKAEKKKKLDEMKQSKKKQKTNEKKADSMQRSGGQDSEAQAKFFISKLDASETGGKLVQSQREKAVHPRFFTAIEGDHSLENLPAHIMEACSVIKKLQESSGSTPAPIVAIVVPSAARGGQICEALRSSPAMKGQPLPLKVS
jgi:hypothetical protein